MFTRLVGSLVVVASLRPAMAERPIDFVHDVIPLLTKHGCNAGACHGAAIGRGGFKLSLYGGTPAADYEAIVRQWGGRRVDLAQADQSLLLRKPTEQLEHGGGMVFDLESNSAHVLLDWIRQGVPSDSVRTFDHLEVTPATHIASVATRIPLQATAYYGDGTRRDVTEWTVFSAEDKGAVEISTEARPHATLLRRGRHIVVARYLTQVVPIELIAPLNESLVTSDASHPQNFIDREILRSLAMLGLPPSPPVDDAGYLRRVSLDLTGRLPTRDQVEDFLQDQNEDKRAKLIDQLLSTEAFTQYWTLQFAKWLRIRPQPNDRQGILAYHGWLADQIREDVSYRQMARQLVLAVGDSHENGPANFYRTEAGPREQAEFFSELLMGTRLRCANCHNHPLDRWTQDDYHGLAAIFAKVESGRYIRDNPRGRTIHPHTLEPALPRIPGEHDLPDTTSDDRQQLADWLTSPTNPYFAKAIVNRLWKQMMGRGFVEPVDDFRATNPATHPALLDELADDFVASGYRLRHTLRTIALSDAYARSSRATPENEDDDRFYAHALRRPLEAEVLADAISDVLGVATTYGEEPAGTRAIALIDPLTASDTLDILGRRSREATCENSVSAASGLAQKLHLFNGALLNARIMAEGSRLQKLLAAGESAPNIIEAFYLAAFSRHPTASERTYWQQQLESQLKSHEDPRSFLEDFVWGVVTSRDFVTNH